MNIPKYIFAVVLFLPFERYYEVNVLSGFSNFTNQTWIGHLFSTIFHDFLSKVLFFNALQNLESIHVEVSGFLITFFGLPIGVIFLHEELSVLSIIGGILVLLGAIVVTLWEHKQNTKPTFPVDTLAKFN